MGGGETDGGASGQHPTGCIMTGDPLLLAHSRLQAERGSSSLIVAVVAVLVVVVVKSH